uniref:Uncharacterized protein n=1 Tax=Meloidogyne incognita TaxID=6306 RepID=A0A914L6E9_MELIC
MWLSGIIAILDIMGGRGFESAWGNYFLIFLKSLSKPLCALLWRFLDSITGHEGCVNSIKWNDSGTLLASGSDDQHLIIWHQNGRLLRRLQTLHSNNIFSVLFVPHAHDHLLLSAAGDSLILLHELDQMSSNDLCHIQKWECKGRVKKMAICKEEPRIFWAVSEDGVLKQCDLRDNKTTDFDFSEEYGSLKSLAINESSSEMLAIGLSSALVPIYDKRNMKEPIMKLLPAHLSVNEEGHFLSTNLEFNKSGNELLVNIGSDNIYIFDVKKNNHASPDIFSTIKSFMSDEKNFPFENTTLEGLSSIKNTNNFTEQFFNQTNKFADEKEFSQAIDNCSEILNFYLLKNGLSKQIFTLSSTNKIISDRISSHILNNSNLIIQCLLTRGRCFMERSWKGDLIDAIKDYLSVLRINPKCKMAHQNLIKNLYALNQFNLAKECLSFYQKLHPEDTSAEHIIGKISEEEDESLNWTSNVFRNYTDRFTGHLNINTDIKEASWFGGDDQYIVAGSDCGSIFIWERQTEKVVKVLKGDNFTVNCVQPHPDRCLIASSGIDKVVRFWEPSTTSLKKITEKDQIEETEDRDISKNKYDLMKKNRRRRTPEMIWEQLINSVGMGIFNVDENNQSDDDENVNNNQQQQQVIHCRQM